MILLLAGELAAIVASFSLAVLIRFHTGSIVVLTGSIWKIIAIASFTLLCAYYMELYDLRGLTASHEVYSRVFKLIGIVALCFAAFAVVVPTFLVERNVLVVGLLILTPVWIIWRAAHERLILNPSFATSLLDRRRQSSPTGTRHTRIQARARYGYRRLGKIRKSRR